MFRKLLGLTLIICALLCIAPACGGAETNAPSLDMVRTINTPAGLLSRHASFEVFMLTWPADADEGEATETTRALLREGDTTLLYESYPGVEYVYDGQYRYLLFPDGSSGVDLELDGSIAAYCEQLITDMALFVAPEGAAASVQTHAGEYVYTLNFSVDDYETATGNITGLDGDVTLISQLWVEANTLDINAWQITALVAETIELPVASGSVVYDAVVLPERYTELRAAPESRTVRLEYADGSAEPVEFTIAEGVVPYTYTPGYAVMLYSDGHYVDADASAIPAEGDITLYLIAEAPADEAQ